MVINMVINKVINIIDNNFDLVENSYFKNLITFNIMVKLNMDYYIHMDWFKVIIDNHKNYFNLIFHILYLKVDLCYVADSLLYII